LSLSMVMSGEIEGLPYWLGYGDSSLSTENLHLVSLAINHTWVGSTKSRYQSGLHQFFRFCDSKGIEAHRHLPTLELLLCGFAASMIGLRGSSTARSNLVTVRAWHIEEGMPYAGSGSVQLLCYYVGLRILVLLLDSDLHTPPCLIQCWSCLWNQRECSKEPWLGQTTDDIVKLPVPSLIQCRKN
jgi:hypothetical protein